MFVNIENRDYAVWTGNQMRKSGIKGWVDLRTFARNFSNIDFFLKFLPLKGDELAMSEM